MLQCLNYCCFQLMPQTDAHHESESSEVTFKVNLSHHFLFTVHSKAVRCWPAVYLQQTGTSRLISCDSLLLKKLFLSISSPTLIFAFISAPLALGNVMKRISIFVGYALLCMLVHYFSFFMSLQGRFSRNAMSNMFL